MAFCFDPQASLPDDVRRVIREQIDIALAGLDNRGEALATGLHEARKCVKRIRALLRLLRKELGNAVYRRENRAFRNAARGLSTARDSAASLETWRSLLTHAPDILPQEEQDRVTEWLELRNQQLVSRLEADSEAVQRAVSELGAARERLAGLPLDQGGFGLLRPGLRRVYAGGRKRYRRSDEDPTAVHLHEWRKQVKYLWHHVRLIAPVRCDQLADELHALSTLLGTDHDLAVLADLIDQQPDLLAPKPSRQVAKRLMQRRRELQKQALQLGGKLYQPKPNAFIATLESAWAGKVQASRK